eukprot:m.362804 g.362804  ORF g.362804 m.362804 type:complete len:76 (-) comp20789_c0_seq4:1221-1448(-)
MWKLSALSLLVGDMVNMLNSQLGNLRMQWDFVCTIFLFLNLLAAQKNLWVLTILLLILILVSWVCTAATYDSSRR